VKWVSIVSDNPIVTFNVFIHDIFTGLKVNEALLIYDDVTERHINRLIPALRKTHKLWTNRPLNVNAIKVSVHPFEFEKAISKVIEEGDCINITPGRKVQALALYRVGLDKGCDVRYHFIKFEKRFGYKPFPLTPLNAIQPLSLTKRKVIEWNPIRLSSYDTPVEVGINTFAGLIHLLQLYSGNNLEVSCNGIKLRITINDLDFNVKIVEGYSRELKIDDIVQALYVSHVVEPSNFNELLTTIMDAIRHKYTILFDTNTYINRLYSLIIENINSTHRKNFMDSVDVLNTVYNELSSLDRYKVGYGLSIEGRKKLIGLYELINSNVIVKTHKGFERARGDAMIVEEIVKVYGNKPKVLLITYDKGLALRAKPKFDVFLVSYNDVREVKAPIEKLHSLLYYLSIIANNVKIYWNRFSFNVEGFWRGKNITKMSIRITSNVNIQWLAKTITETLSLANNLIR